MSYEHPYFKRRDRQPEPEKLIAQAIDALLRAGACEVQRPCKAFEDGAAERLLQYVARRRR